MSSSVSESSHSLPKVSYSDIPSIDAYHSMVQCLVVVAALSCRRGPKPEALLLYLIFCCLMQTFLACKMNSVFYLDDQEAVGEKSAHDGSFVSCSPCQMFGMCVAKCFFIINGVLLSGCLLPTACALYTWCRVAPSSHKQKAKDRVSTKASMSPH